MSLFMTKGQRLSLSLLQAQFDRIEQNYNQTIEHIFDEVEKTRKRAQAATRKVQKSKLG